MSECGGPDECDGRDERDYQDECDGRDGREGDGGDEGDGREESDERNEGGRVAGVTVREATPDDRLGVRRVLDAAMLAVRSDLGARIAAGDVLVAGETEEVEDAAEGDDDSRSQDAPVLGALVLVPGPDGTRDAVDSGPRGATDGASSETTHGAHVNAVAVRRARRGQGVGTALVRAAVERYPRLTAEFDPDVRPFYESLGFEISSVEGENERLRGRYEA